MKELTNEMIIESLNKNSPFLKLELILFGVMILVFGIVYFIKFKREQNSGRKKGIIISVVILLVLIGIPVFKGVFEYNAIQYSIKHECFEVVTDTIVRTDSITGDNGNKTYYIYLNDNGKMTVSRRDFYNFFNGNSVYVVIAKGRLGGRYKTGQIYLTSEYQYVNK